MELEKLIEYYENNHKSKVFFKKLKDENRNFYIMYIYKYEEELDNFRETFFYYLPFYVRSSDQLKTIDFNNVENELTYRSRKIRIDKILPKRKVEVNGIYGEVFLDFYLRIVCKRKSIITYAIKRSYNSNFENYGPDNFVYYIENEKINICFGEAKFVSNVTSASDSLIEDGKNHVDENYLNDYISFVVSKDIKFLNEGNYKFLSFINDLNNNLDKDKKFIELIKENEDVYVDFIFFAIFKNNEREIKKLKKYYDEIYNETIDKIQKIGFKRYNIEIVFIPTKNDSMLIKKEIDKKYE